MAEDNTGLILASIVAIIAIVGLVMIFSAGNSGATGAVSQNLGCKSSMIILKDGCINLRHLGPGPSTGEICPGGLPIIRTVGHC